MSISSFDHVAVPAGRVRELLVFYRALGFAAPEPDEWLASNARSFAVQFGQNKINFHAPWFWQDPTFTLRGPTARPGCGDFCFVWAGTLETLKARLAEIGAEIEEGPVERVGGRGTGVSIYTRDPDANLLEFIVYADQVQGTS